MAILLDFEKVGESAQEVDYIIGLKTLRFFRSEARWPESGTYAA